MGSLVAGALTIQGCEQTVEVGSKAGDALREEAIGDVVEGYAQLGKHAEALLCLGPGGIGDKKTLRSSSKGSRGRQADRSEPDVQNALDDSSTGGPGQPSVDA